MAYSIANDGDYYEVQYWGFLKNDFPNYEEFWNRYIIPLTKRTEGQGIGLKESIDPLLESLAMAHYTVFYHLGVTADLQARLGQEFSEDILFHLSSATEMAERLIFILAKLNATLRNAELASQLAEGNIPEITLEYLSSKGYTKEFARFLHRGQSVNVRLHNMDDVTKPFMQSLSEQAEKDFEDWQDIANQIRHYRNTLAHNPRLGVLLKGSKRA
jgi:hypothetical protein